MILKSSVVQELLGSPDAFMVSIAAIMETEFTPAELYGTGGDEGLDITTIVAELDRKYSVEVHSAVRNKMQAIITLRTTDMFENDVTAFAAITLACVEGQLGDLISGIMEEPEMQDALWCILEAAIVDPDLEEISQGVVGWLSGLQGDMAEDGDAPEIDVFQQRSSALVVQLGLLGIPPDTVDALMARGMSAISEATQ